MFSTNDIIGQSLKLEGHAQTMFDYGFEICPMKNGDDFHIIKRNCDGLEIGRVHVDGDQWCGRYWFFGGGTTFGGFKTKWLAAMWVLIRNVQLGEGWDS